MSSKLVGLDAYRLMMRSAQAGRIPHAVLFTGPKGTGKKTAALELGMLANCTGSGEKPCGLCKSCRLALSHEHPNFIYPALDGKHTTITVDDIRDMLRDINGSGTGTGARVVIFEQASLLNLNDQNALLKTLETPPDNCIFIFVSETTEVLLPTILSRVEKIRMHPIPNEDVCFVLKQRGMDAERAELLASISDGCVGKALELDKDEDYWTLRSKAKQALSSLKRPYDAFRAAEILAEPKSAKSNREKETLRRSRIFELFELWARDRMRIEHGLEPGETGEKEFLQSLSFHGEDLLKSLVPARKKNAAYIKWEYTLETLFLSLL